MAKLNRMLPEEAQSVKQGELVCLRNNVHVPLNWTCVAILIFLSRQVRPSTSFGKERNCLLVHQDASFLLLSLIKCYCRCPWKWLLIFSKTAKGKTTMPNWWHSECSLKTESVLGNCFDKFNRPFIPVFWHVPAQSGKWWKRFKCHIQPCSFKAAIQFYAERYIDLCSWKW